MLSLPEIAMQKVDTTFSQMNSDNVRTLFVVGSKSAGKTTLLNTFLDKNDTPRETLVLEYSFGRKSNQKHSIEKTVSHIWEYGGKLGALKEIMPAVPNFGKYYLCLMIDLSKIKRIWDTIETVMQALKDSCSETEKLPEILIIGGKYDIFRNYDSEIKKIICTTIRSLGILHNAHIIFYTAKDAQSSRRMKEILQHAGFGNGIIFKENNTHFGKPLMIPKGSDSWEGIGVTAMTLEQLKVRHLTRIPPEPFTSETIIETSQKTSHPEPSIDKLAGLKYAELQNMESDISV